MFNRLRQAWLAWVIAVVSGEAIAEANIAATIAPVHSLASMVAEGVSSPALIVKPGASPHGYAMKPSEARALDEADVVFWVGEALEPWMGKAITTLASDALVVELGIAPGVNRLGVREGGIWESHDHDDGLGDHDDDPGSHNDDPGSHDKNLNGQDHENDNRGHRYDPHLWLDPENAIAWLQAMATALSMVDPENARIYQANAGRAAGRLRDLASSIEADLAAVRTTPYIVFHDAYQYFEQRFVLNIVGSISLSDADRPGAGRLTELLEWIRKTGAVCAFAEPQFEPKLLDTVIENSRIRKALLDPIGADLEPGTELYPLLMERLTTSLVDCLS